MSKLDDSRLSRISQLSRLSRSTRASSKEHRTPSRSPNRVESPQHSYHSSVPRPPSTPKLVVTPSKSPLLAQESRPPPVMYDASTGGNHV